MTRGGGVRRADTGGRRGAFAPPKQWSVARGLWPVIAACSSSSASALARKSASARPERVWRASGSARVSRWERRLLTCCSVTSWARAAEASERTSKTKNRVSFSASCYDRRFYAPMARTVMGRGPVLDPDPRNCCTGYANLRRLTAADAASRRAIGSLSKEPGAREPGHDEDWELGGGCRGAFVRACA